MWNCDQNLLGTLVLFTKKILKKYFRILTIILGQIFWVFIVVYSNENMPVNAPEYC